MTYVPGDGQGEMVAAAIPGGEPRLSFENVRSRINGKKYRKGIRGMHAGYRACVGTGALLEPAHDCIIYTRLVTGNEWYFAGPDGEIVIPVQGRYQADNSEGVREGVLGGLGIGVIPIWLFNDDEIRRGDVRIILKEFEPTSLPIHAVYPSRRLAPTKVPAMIEFLDARPPL